MTERDDELQKLLRRWEAPQPRPELDRRVMRSFRQQRSRRVLKWLPIAAGVVLAAGLAQHWRPHEKHARGSEITTLDTTTNAAGYEPIPDGAITVVKEEKKQ